MAHHQLKLKVLLYEEEGGFVAQCLNVNVASEGDTEQDALANIREALELYFDEEVEPDILPVQHVRVTDLTLQGA
jgi:predicted RNase H-like HicB family nuclease